MFIVKKGNKYYFGVKKDSGHIWGERKALAKRYVSDSEIPEDFRNRNIKLLKPNSR